MGLAKSILYAIEFSIPAGISVTKSPLLFPVNTAELAAGILVILVENVLEYGFFEILVPVKLISKLP